MLTDTHCHLDDSRFDDDREEVISRALDAGVRKMLIPGIDLESSISAIEIADSYPEVFAAVGIHPNRGVSWDDDSIQNIEKLVQHPKVVAIGEIGLDYYRDATKIEVQKNIFQSQLELAAKFDLPVVIHNREATDDILHILSKWHQKLRINKSKLVDRPGVLHSYSGKIEDAEIAMASNFYIGITGPITFKKADDLRETIKSIDSEKLLIETDSPYLTPHPFRGKRNEPMHVKLVAEKVAGVLGISTDNLIKLTHDNSKRLFRW